MSEISEKEVILCKSAVESNDAPDEYVNTFEKAGFKCKHLTVLTFQFVNLDDLKNRLLSPSSYGGLILTSKRAVEAISFSLEGHPLPEEWKSLPIFCVGPATACLAETNLGLKNSLDNNCGNSKELADCIVKRIQQGMQPLLYPCSTIARDTIEQILTTSQVNFEKIFVYDTLPTKTLQDDLAQLADNSEKIFIFFSPSAVEYTLDAANKITNFLDKMQAVAIGPVTADALAKHNVHVRAVSSKPEPHTLLETIQLAKLL